MIISVEEFNNTFVDNYEYLHSYAKVVSGRNHNRFEQNIGDIVNDVYCVVKERIEASGVTGHSALAYIKFSIRAALYGEIRPDLIKNRRKFVPFFESKNVEEVLQTEEEYCRQHELYDENSMNKSKSIFQFLEKRYDEKELFIFKSYYLMKKRMTYKRLSKQTGFSITQCSLTIKKIKADIKENFENWYKSN